MLLYWFGNKEGEEGGRKQARHHLFSKFIDVSKAPFMYDVKAPHDERCQSSEGCVQFGNWKTSHSTLHESSSSGSLARHYVPDKNGWEKTLSSCGEKEGPRKFPDEPWQSRLATPSLSTPPELCQLAELFGKQIKQQCCFFFWVHVCCMHGREREKRRGSHSKLFTQWINKASQWAKQYKLNSCSPPASVINRCKAFDFPTCRFFLHCTNTLSPLGVAP